MNAIVVDANVWLAAIDSASNHWRASRASLERVQALGWQVIVPALARIEVSCALARRLRNPARARRITESLLRMAEVRETPIDPAALERAFLMGTERFLKGLDAFYAAEAASQGIQCLSWDGELRQRARAITPTEWLESVAA